MRNLSIKLLKKIQGIELPVHLISKLSFKRISYVSMFRAEYKFRLKIRSIIQKICKHTVTYKDTYWSGGFLVCSHCSKRLKTLWLPEARYANSKDENKK